MTPCMIQTYSPIVRTPNHSALKKLAPKRTSSPSDPTSPCGTVPLNFVIFQIFWKFATNPSLFPSQYSFLNLSVPFGQKCHSRIKSRRPKYTQAPQTSCNCQLAIEISGHLKKCVSISDPSQYAVCLSV